MNTTFGAVNVDLDDLVSAFADAESDDLGNPAPATSTITSTPPATPTTRYRTASDKATALSLELVRLRDRTSVVERELALCLADAKKEVLAVLSSLEDMAQRIYHTPVTSAPITSSPAPTSASMPATH